MRYRDYTRGTSEWLKRIAHRTRLKDAAELLDLRQTDHVLDYGCGDGALFDELDSRVPPANLYGFDPGFLSEMERTDIRAYDSADVLVANHAGAFDAIYCTEVCEHLTDSALDVLFANMRRLGREDATFLFGVPIETGIPGCLKNLYRIAKGGRQGATWRKAWAALIGRRIARHSESPGWIGSHIGFCVRDFAERLSREGFDIISRDYLPWPRLRRLNNEIYFTCKLRPERRATEAPLALAA